MSWFPDIGIEPYFQDDDVVIFHGDCREILPLLRSGSVGLVLTDPPYGIGLETAYRLRGRGPLAESIDYPEIIGDDHPFDAQFILDLGLPTVLWGANYYARALPEVSGWLVWDKRRGRMQNDQADAELAWTNFIKGVRVYSHEWNGFHRDSEKGEHYHPTQKPVALMRWCLESRWTPAGTILDPFLGSGTTARAAKDLGLKCVGIEIEQKYCQIAANRMAQSVMNL